jgi:hypothetical protein
MTQATINGNTYSDDGTSSKDMLNGGHRTHFIPMVGDVATAAGVVATQAAQTAIDAANAANGALATKGTSTTSLAVSAGSKSITTQSGKQFTAGNFVTISRTSAPTTLMHGVVTAYSGTALTVEVSTISGSGTYTDWTIALSGAQGAQGPSGNGVMPYSAKTGAYTIVTTDRGSLIDCTSGTFTLAFQACATLGADWSCYIRNSGTGVVTLDPSGAETIDGAATFTLYPGTTEILQCDGTMLRVASDGLAKPVRLPIFSAAALVANAASTLEDITPARYTVFGGGFCYNLCYGNSLFLTSNNSSTSGIGTSPDGITWTLRAMPSNNIWGIGTNGTTGFIGYVAGGTATAKSTDGITWAAGTALPAIANGSLYPVAYLGTTAIVVGGSNTACFVSTNNATSWSAAQTFPSNPTTSIFVIAGLFWYFASGTTAYTSTTGLTGSWTSRTLPVTPSSGNCFKDTTGKLVICAGAGTQQWETVDGINWTALSYLSSQKAFTLGGVRVIVGAAFGACKTWHGGLPVVRTSVADALVLGSNVTLANNGAGVTLTANNSAGDGSVCRFGPTFSQTALFTR